MKLLKISLAVAFFFGVQLGFAQSGAGPTERRLPADVRARLAGATKSKATSGDSLSRLSPSGSKTIILKPAFGYVWRNPKNEESLSVRLRDGLRKVTRFSVAPAEGYYWVNSENPFDAGVLRVGLLMNADSTLKPDSGFVWVNPTDSKDQRVRVRDGLVRYVDGTFGPATGYAWATTNPNDLSVTPVSANHVSPPS